MSLQGVRHSVLIRWQFLPAYGTPTTYPECVAGALRAVTNCHIDNRQYVQRAHQKKQEAQLGNEPGSWTSLDVFTVGRTNFDTLRRNHSITA